MLDQATPRAGNSAPKAIGVNFEYVTQESTFESEGTHQLDLCLFLIIITSSQVQPPEAAIGEIFIAGQKKAQEQCHTPTETQEGKWQGRAGFRFGKYQSVK